MAIHQKKTRHALRDDPLREPGQSLREELEKVRDDELLVWVMMSIFAGMFAIYEWARWFLDSGFHPVIFSIAALLVVGVSVYRVRRVMPRIDRIKKGIRGELLAGQFLQNELLPLGFKVYHDLIEDDYNIDHVAIGPKGVFSIETKAFSKPEAGEALIVHDGEQLLVNGLAPDRNPIRQAEAIADRVQKILPSLQSGPISVRPVVLVAGWRVDRRNRSRRTWVVNFGGLMSFLDREPNFLSPADIEYLSRALFEYQQIKSKRSN